MTRRKDILRNRTERVRISQQKRNSRLEQRKQENRKQNEEKMQEKQLLTKIDVLPDELIRLIYDYITGEAKLHFNPKYERLCIEFCSYPFQPDLEIFFKKMSNIQILDLIYTGTFRKYPEIVEDLSYNYYYSTIDHDFHTVKGYHLLNLWATNRLSYDFMIGEHTTNNHLKTELDANIRNTFANVIKNYILNTLYSFQKYQRNDLDDKTNYRKLFLGMEKAYYLYKVIMRFIDKPTVKVVPITTITQTTDPFSNELLIPTPLYLH